MLEIAVFDKDDKREQAIGFAYVEASQIFSAEASAAGGVELTVKLQSKRLVGCCQLVCREIELLCCSALTRI